MAHRDIISQNRTELCELTPLRLRILTRCQDERILSSDDLDLIDLDKPKFARNREFYDIMCQKSYNAFLKFIKILESEDSEADVLKILKKNLQEESKGNVGSGSSETPDLRIDEKDVHWIATAFADDRHIVLKKEQLYSELGLSPAGIFQMLKTANNSGSPDYSFFSHCISTWVSGKKGGGGPLKDLEQALIDSKLDGLAEYIRNEAVRRKKK